MKRILEILDSTPMHPPQRAYALAKAAHETRMSQLTVVDEVGETNKVSLAKAILLDQSHTHCAATVHDVAHAEGKPSLILPGKGISLQGLQNLVVALAGGERASDYLSETILAASLTRLVWWCPSKVRPIWFQAKSARLNRLDGASVTHPNLVFAATPQGLSVWAIAGEKRPTPKSPLFHAPYLNVWDSGGVCQGTT